MNISFIINTNKNNRGDNSCFIYDIIKKEGVIVYLLIENYKYILE